MVVVAYVGCTRGFARGCALFRVHAAGFNLQEAEARRVKEEAEKSEHERRFLELQRQQEAERQKQDAVKAEEKKKELEQKMILGKGGIRSKLSFSLGFK